MDTTQRDSLRGDRYHCPTCDAVIERVSKEPVEPPAEGEEWGWLANYVPNPATAHPCGHQFRLDWGNVNRLIAAGEG